MFVHVIVYIVVFVVCCVCVITFEHLLCSAHVVSHCCSSSWHACHVLCLWLLFMFVPSFVKLVMDLDSIAFLFCTSVLFETRLSMSFENVRVADLNLCIWCC